MTHQVGIIGCGWFSHFYANVLPALAGRAAVRWVADPDMAKAEALARKTGARPLSDYRDGLDEVDAVFVLVPHHLHHPITLEALEAGCHVLLEKPIAVSLEEADAMIDTADRLKKTLMIAYPHRYRKSMQLLKQAVTDGRYGKLFMLDGLMDESMQEYTLGWLSKRATLGGGVFFSSSPHMLDVMLWIAGDVQSVSMVGTRAACQMEGEDTAISVIKFTSGVVGTTRQTWASPKTQIWYTMHAVCERAHVTLTTTPVGDLFHEGAKCPWHTRVVALSGAGEEVLHDSDEGLDVQPEIEHFFDCIETGQTPQTDGRTARKVIKLVLDAYEEAERKGANV